MSQIKKTLDLTSTITKISYEEAQELPESYQIAAEIMREDILKQLYLQIYNKKKKQKDPNYDEYLRQIQSSSSIQIPLVTFGVQFDKFGIFGDRMGGVTLYDITKKMILSRKQVSSGRRIISISLQSFTVADITIATIAVVAKGDPSIHILRFKTNENKLFLNFQIQTSKVEPKQGNNISDYPYQVKLSKYGLILAAALYNGSIILYSIPQVKKVNPQQELNKKSTQIGNISSSAPIINLDEACIKLSTCEGTIPFAGVLKRKTYKEMIDSMKKPVIQVPAEPVKQQKKKEAPKGKDDKKDPKAVIQQKKEQIKPPPNLEFNDSIVYPAVLIEQSRDYSVDIANPKFRPYFYFLNQYICAPGDKQFSSIRSAAVTTKLLILWTNTIKFNVFSLRQSQSHNIPEYLYPHLFQSERPKQKDSLKIELSEETKTIYPITSSTSSQDQSLLALGMRDGTVQVWDVSMSTLKFNFDKHTAPVKCLRFFQVFKLISGGQDGSVMIHDLEKHQTVMKRTNIFQSKTAYSIIDIQINSAGIAYVLDSLCNVKIYDLWRNQKVGVLVASPPQRHTNKFRKWNVQTPTMIIITDQLVILSDNISEESNAGKKSTYLQVFKIFQNLLTLFDALAVIYRKGIDRQKVINIFSNLEMNQLYQKTFQLPDTVHHDESQTKKHSSSKGLATISEVPVSNDNSMISKKKSSHVNDILQPEIKMFSRKRTPKINLPNEQWLIKEIRDQHCKKQQREHKLLNVTLKSEISFNS